MTLSGWGSPSGTLQARRESKRTPQLSKNAITGKNGVSSQRRLHAESDRLANRLPKDSKRSSKSGVSHISEFSGINPWLGQPHAKSYMSHRNAPLAKPLADSRARHANRSLSRQPDRDLERAVQFMARKRSDMPSKGGDGKNSRKTLAKAKDSLLLAKSSPELKRSKSETVKYSRHDVGFERYEKKPSSKIESRKTKSNALVTKRNSKFMLINEKLNQSSLPGVPADDRPPNGRVFGCLFFTGKTRIPARTEVIKEGKKVTGGKNGRKVSMHSTSKREPNEDKKKSKKNTDEKRTRNHSEAKKSRRPDGLQTKASKSHPKKPEKKDRKKTKAYSSKDLKTLCEVEISQRKKVSGLVVKVYGKHSKSRPV